MQDDRSAAKSARHATERDVARHVLELLESGKAGESARFCRSVLGDAPAPLPKEPCDRYPQEPARGWNAALALVYLAVLTVAVIFACSRIDDAPDAPDVEAKLKR